MKKVFVIALIVSMISVARPANAIIDIMATIQSGLELKTEIMNKIEAVQKKIMDAYKRAVQGFQAASNCFANPLKCDIKTLGSLGKGAIGSIKSITGVRTVPGAEKLASSNLKTESAKGLDKEIMENYTFIEGQKNSLEATAKKKQELNAVTADEIAILFAKAMATRQSIRNEKAEEIYSNDIGESQSDILAVHNTLTLKSQERLSRILELRAYMIGADATKELSKNSVKKDELDEQLSN